MGTLFPRDLIKAIDDWQAGNLGENAEGKRPRRIVSEIDLD
jgi:hypothetical protein